MRILALVLATVATAVLTAACGPVVEGRPVAATQGGGGAGDQSLVVEYFERSNAAARDGTAAQQQFLRQTQHPDFEANCDLGDLTVLLEPSLSTLRPDQDWRPPATDRPPRGRVYVVAVTATVQRNRTTLGVQIGSVHVVVLDDTAYGFAPCPS